MKDPLEHQQETSPAADAPSASSLDAPDGSFHDLLIAATDDDFDVSLDRFVTVARRHLGAPVALVLHPAVGATTWLSDDATDALVETVNDRHQRSASVFPIDGPGGRLFGWFVVDAPDLDEERHLLALRLVRLFAQALTRLVAEDSPVLRNRRDLLTGLANRRALETALWAAASERSQPWSLVVCGLVALDEVEADHGAEVVESIMRAVADRIAGTVRDGDLAVRFDEGSFAVLLDAGEHETTRMVERLRDVVSGPVVTSSATVDVRAEIRAATANTTEQVTRLVDVTEASFPR